MNVIISSADYWTRGNIKANSVLEVDNVQFVYNSKLASLSYNGVSVPSFDKDKAEYTITAESFDKSLLQATADGVGATVEVSEDVVNHIFTITVKGNDIAANAENYHVYTVKVNPVSITFTNSLTVGINGATSEPQNTEIQLVKELDGTYTFALNNFMLGELGIGNVRLSNLTVNGNVFTANQVIQITEGDAEGIDFWMGPMLGDVPVALKATKLSETEMVADIDIDMSATLEQVIKVVFAPLVEINDTEDMAALNGLYNVKLNRKFVAGWNTVCLPFGYQGEAFSVVSGVKVQAFDSATAEGLNFTTVEGAMAANMPYLIWFPMEYTEPVYFGVNIENTTPLSITKGDFTFTGTYAAVTDMAGKYGVANIDGVDKITKGAAGSTVKGTRAYFTTSGADVQSVNLFFDGEATGIAGVEATKADTFDVYTLSGVQVRRSAQTLEGLAKGIYIVNGKKQVVK
ncbi:MAG: calycin-like domain-containing protein [Clostridium sp.]|nr:calycin-like domain-containing protein [Clostridium sp.]